MPQKCIKACFYGFAAFQLIFQFLWLQFLPFFSPLLFKAIDVGVSEKLKYTGGTGLYELCTAGAFLSPISAWRRENLDFPSLQTAKPGVCALHSVCLTLLSQVDRAWNVVLKMKCPKWGGWPCWKLHGLNNPLNNSFSLHLLDCSDKPWVGR